MRLIDADALLQKFNDIGIQITFDLPVEEILGEDVDIDDFTMLVQDAVQAYRKMVIGVIQEQPTAYNAEKVKKEIDRVGKSFCDYVACNEECTSCDHHSIMKSVKEIIRKGGAT